METRKELVLIPKTENYIKYILNMILKLPRTEKFSIGTEYKENMYKMLEDILMLSKINCNEEKMNYLNRIDAKINVQRIFLRIMCENHWIDEKKFDYSIGLLDEIGKIIGGLLKYYGKNIKKPI